MNKEVKAYLKSKEKFRVFKYYKKGKNATADFFEWNNLFFIFRYLIFLFTRTFVPAPLNNWVYRLFGVKIGKNVLIGVEVVIDPFYPKLITIGNDCVLGWGTKLLAHEGYLRHYKIGRVNIGNNVLIGAFSIIRAGIDIGNNTIIAMAAVVDKDIAHNEVVGGVPEHEIKKLTELM